MTTALAAWPVWEAVYIQQTRFFALIGGGRSFVHRADVFALRSKAGSGFGVSQ
jgi:hypothetical protein